MSGVSSARTAAFQILMTVERGQAHADDLLRGKAVDALSDADRKLTTALVLGVLRWQIRLEHEVRWHLARPNAKLDPEVRIALRLGAFQLRKMDRIPVHAVIDESVELVKEAGHHFASRMVNAVLRKLSKGTVEFPAATPAGLALAMGHPEWMVERWADFYGVGGAREICAHGQEQSVAAVRIEDPAVEQGLGREGVMLQPAALLTAARRVSAGDVTGTAAFGDGRVWLQDEGSQLVAELAGRGDAILDCCAAPGGKTLILAERNPQAKITAREASQVRFERLRARLARLGERVVVQLGDAAEVQDEGSYDLVLVDVPCSGTGTLGRNPEIRHRLKIDDLGRHAERQQAILRAALQAARPGGRVVYSTCSLEPEENEQVVAAVLATGVDAHVVFASSRVGEMEKEGILRSGAAERLQGCVTREGFLRLLPGVFHTDGFFVAILEKAAG